ncbi:hypothetical protein vseg_010603 [Gypsophila vaccaria]
MAIHEAPVFSENDEQEVPTITNQQMEESADITEELQQQQHRRPDTQNLALEIPSTCAQCSLDESVKINILAVSSPVPKRVNFSPMHSPGVGSSNKPSTSTMLKNKSSFKTLLPKLSFKFKNASSDIEKAAILALQSPSSVRTGRPQMTRNFSISRLFTSRGNKASSLPVTPIAHSNPGSTHGSNRGITQIRMHRSRSVPLLVNKDGSIRQVDSISGVFRVIPTPRAQHGTSIESSGNTTITDGNEDNGEDIPEEEAICRICFEELGEGSETLKMECSCKGELALIHQECAVKWFSLKGNQICEVCKQEVKNLPVTLLRIQNAQSQGNVAQQSQLSGYRVWQDVPVLVIVSMLAYFCFLEQILLKNMGTNAIAVSIPLSCVMGLLASMMSTTMVTRRFIWVYAAVQFILVVVMAHILFSVVHILAIVSVIIATFVGLAVTMCGCSMVCEVLRWWRVWRARSVRQRDVEAGLPATASDSEPTNIPQNIQNQPEPVDLAS